MAENVSQWFASVGGVLALIAPKGLCPICVAASGGMLASLGLGFLTVERNVRWILAVALTVGVTGMVLSARRHRRWWTLVPRAQARRRFLPDGFFSWMPSSAAGWSCS